MRRIALVLILICLVAVPTAALRAQGGETTHTVAAGDNLFRISLRYNVPIATIAQANGIANVNLIFVGQVLKIPGAATGGATQPPTQPPAQGTSSYVVQQGDTLFSIARKFGSTVTAIASANGIVNVNLIFPGRELQVPAGGGVVVQPPTGGGTSGTGSTQPVPGTTFALGGQILDLNSNTQQVLKSAKMTWVKRQAQAGDNNAPALIQQAKAAGFKILLSVVGDKNSVLDAGYQNNYAIYVGQLAQAGADAIEIWNEMNIDREWPTGQINPASYVTLLQKSYNAIKAVNPNTVVISGALSPTGAEGAFGLSRVWNDDRYYNGLGAAGAAKYADCIGIHYNEGIVPPAQNSGDPRGNYPTRYFTTMLNRALAPFPGKPACFTEIGYLSPEGYGQLPAGFEWGKDTSAAEQAQWLAEAVSRARQSGRISLFVVFNIDFTNFGADPQAGYAIVRPGNVCLACATLAAVAP